MPAANGAYEDELLVRLHNSAVALFLIDVFFGFFEFLLFYVP